MKSSSALTRTLGVCSLVGSALLVWLGLIVAPADVTQGEHVRLLFLHPALAWTTYLAVAITALGSALYLYPRTRSRFWDLLASSSAEVGAVFCALALATGAIWGRPTWGVWWTWDARLTSTALLMALLLGYLALRRASVDSSARARHSAVAGLIVAADVPVVHLSVEWWNTLHQERTLLQPSPTVEGVTLATMVFSIVVMHFIFAWLLTHRFRIERSEAVSSESSLEVAIADRRAEGVS